MMNPNAKRANSQTAKIKQPPRPLCFIKQDNAVLTVWPRFLAAGYATIRIDTKYPKWTNKLSCKVKCSQLQACDFKAPVGTVICTAQDPISPDLCARKGYRDDGLGYLRTLTITVLPEDALAVAICCTLCSQDEQGALHDYGTYAHTEAIRLPAAALQTEVQRILAASEAAKEEPSHGRKNLYRKPY